MAAKARQKLINVPHAAWDESQVVSQVEIAARINFVASAAFHVERTPGQTVDICFSFRIQSNAKMIERLLHASDDTEKKKKKRGRAREQEKIHFELD